jgi:hypothetical protein
MALQNKLKAFVRFDGSGRVIPSSLILQKSKPKVGNWKEINATQCCNDTPTTTTTTTADPRPRISLSACGALLPYQEITIVNGSSICDPMIYITGDFSQLQQAPFYVIVGSSSRVFGAMGNQAYPSAPCTSCGGGTTTTTTTQVQSYSWQALYSESSKNEACSGTYLSIYTSTPYLSDNVTIYLNPSLTQPVLHNYISSGGRVWQCMSGFMYGEQNCSALTTTTTTTNGTGLYPISNAASAGADFQFCVYPVSQLNQQPNLHCSTPTLQVGSTLYASNDVNNLFTQPYVNNVDFAGAYAVSNGVITSLIPC